MPNLSKSESKGHSQPKGEKAFEASPFAVVVCDMLMPQQEGLETIRHVRQTNPNVAVVAISAGLALTSNLDILDIAQKLEAPATLRKPFRISHLAVAVDQALTCGSTSSLIPANTSEGD